MQRKTPIAALEKAKAIASSLRNPSIDAFKAAGGKVIGCFDPDTPVELIEAFGFLPFDMRGTGADGTEFAGAYFRQLTCDFTRTTFNLILEGKYSFLDGAVVYNCCDHLRRAFDNWQTIANNPAYHFIYVPKKRDDEAYGLYRDEIARFIASTEERFGVKLCREKLAGAIREANRTRLLIRDLYELRKGDSVLVDGAEVATLLTINGSLPRAEYNALLEEAVAELRASGEGVTPRRRLMLVSGHANKPEFLEALESQGGLVVADIATTGLKSALALISEEGDPLENLMHYYFWDKSPMPRVFGTQDQRVEEIIGIADEYRVDGIISARLTMCDLWAFEQYMLTSALEEAGIPHLALEVNYILDGVGQIRTRVQAFVENCPKRMQ